MPKKFLIFLLYILLLVLPFLPLKVNSIIMPCVYAQEAMKINSINFDNSDSIIFLGTSSIDSSMPLNITKKILTEPDRVYFDIENAVITFSNTTYELKNSRLKQVKIAQNSISPNIVRIVIWSSEGYDTSKIQVINVKNNIIIKLGTEKPLQQYFTQVYKETKESDIEYYDKAVVIAEGKNTDESNEIFNSVQRAFSTEGQELVRPNIEQKQARLKSRFFLDNVKANSAGLLISGIGVINVEKPFILTEPSRIVFDLPNTIVLQELREKEIKLSENTVAKIGQFEPSKARIVIKTPTPDVYNPIYSTNLQTLLITNGTNIKGISPLVQKTELTSFKEKIINASTDEINIIFSNPVIYSIKKENTNVKVTFYNLEKFNEHAFNAYSQKNKSKFKVVKKSENIYTLVFNEAINDLLDCYESLNATQLRFVVTKQTAVLPELKPQEQTTESISKEIKEKKHKKIINFKLRPVEIIGKKKSKYKQTKQENVEKRIIEKINQKTIVLDPGHGGNDTGAMRADVLEKDLTLQIALKVKEALMEKGLTNIIMTRSTDKTLSLDERVQIANMNETSIYVSIHINASVKSEIKGIETHYYTQSGYNVAKFLHKELMNNVNATDRGLFKSKFYVIKHTEAPSVLLELGFISNEHERSELVSKERQAASAQAIADGIVKYLTENLNE